MTEDIAFEEEYEEYLSDLGLSDHQTSDGLPSPTTGRSAWSRLPEFVTDISDSISDSESIVSIGELGDDTRLDVGRDDREVPDENRNNWEVGDRKTSSFFLENWSLTCAFVTSAAYEPEDDGGPHEVSRRGTAVELRRRPAPCASLRAGRQQCAGTWRRGRRTRTRTHAEGIFRSLPSRRRRRRS